MDRQTHLGMDHAATRDELDYCRQCPTIVGVGTAVPPNSVSQTDLLTALQVDDPRVRSIFLRGGIERRNLCLPHPGADLRLSEESQAELLAKHLSVGLRLGTQAIDACLARADARYADIRHLCCVSSTGFIIPGLSALLIKTLGLPVNCSRLDVVGMGCNAGLNALSSVSAWTSKHPGELAIMVCIEVCSAMYVFETDLASAVVNSLFGDGAAALAVISGGGSYGRKGPRLLDFSSHLVPEASQAMRIEWSESHGKFKFCLDPRVPYVVGEHSPTAVGRLLNGTGIALSDVTHWIVHSGGRKVIDAVRVNLGLTRMDVRHTLNVLRDHGNVSSASFLFSYERLLLEGTTTSGDIGVMMTMGPGTSIETALLKW
ncbi:MULTISPECIES: 3,5-dihydroxyphenylacetyl-CoA synthase DpgA [unclassified Bradyrhizobium]|uniref:3,5-dihydroxyphenylacetyl-CoA synthase DpgA n=1 Tax=unclassified Bradyrhizobium TaxID=2631580 RepID=UPI0028F127B2|nr:MULTISPECIES: 3,5-dihydroxyphenylacetyl-CoA synthase DpgA [unclassified Bradyrhizobium]